MDFKKNEIENLKRANRMLYDIIDRLDVGVHASDSKGVTILFNTKLEQIEGVNRKNVINKNIETVYKFTDTEKPFSSQLHVLQTKEPWLNKHIEYISPSGKVVDGLLSTYPYIENDEIKGVYTISSLFSNDSEPTQMNNKMTFHKRLIKNNGTRFEFGDLIGSSKVFLETIETAKRLTKNKSAILIYGATGTGKELFAQSIHNASGFANGQFVPINAAAIPDTLLESILFGSTKGAYTGAVESIGLFETAENGTLFLDELNAMSIQLQAKILRVIQEREIQRLGENKRRKINCRIVCAMNKEPLVAVNDKELRSDLYYRISAVTLQLPSLSERIDDIDDLTDYFIGRFNAEYGMSVKRISEELRQIFLDYLWPGNVRELEHTVEGAMNLVDVDDDVLDIKHLPRALLRYLAEQKKQFRKAYPNASDANKMEVINDALGLTEILERYEREIIVQSLIKNHRNISHTASELKILRQSLYYKIGKYDIDLDKIEYESA